MKILTIVGARPQFIKSAVVSRAVQKYNENNNNKIEEMIVHTGQHYDENMSRTFFEELHIPKPKYNLGVGSGSHGKQTGEMLAKIEEVIIEEKPDLINVYGDTNSTLAGALAASKLHVDVIHIEAGLRSYNMNMPEEQNRILTDHISTYLSCPTETAIKNLSAEGIYDGKKLANNRVINVTNTGDVMYDAIIYNRVLAKEKSNKLKELELKPKEYILGTIHRAENTDDKSKLSSIIKAFSEVGSKVIIPLHPRTRKLINGFGIEPGGNIRFIEPIGYLDMILLEENASFIVTDSGGVQKEAYFLKTPCLTVRNQTEWVETVQSGWNKLVPETEFHKLARYIDEFVMPDKTGDFFGDGKAGEKIVKGLMSF